MKSSSSNSGWFSSEGENDETEDAFFSLSSGYFSESFRRKPDENCRKMYNQKSSEMCRCSSELSVNSVSTALMEKRTNGRVGSNLDESKWVKSRNGNSKTVQNRGETSKTARKTAGTCRKKYSSEMSHCSSKLSRTNGRVGSNLDELKWVKSINGLDFASSKTEQNRGKTSRTANQKESEMTPSSSELSTINGRVDSNLDESKWVKSINELDFTTSKTEQNRGKTSHKTAPRSSRRTLRKTIPVEKFDYYSDFNSDSRRKTTKCRRKIKKSSSTSSDEMGKFKIVIDGRIEESIAVEKNTNDPYSDFRTSMLEMIVEKQIFGFKDLQKLLHCFLSLNSPSFHKIIFEVFSEICETLFHQL
ncbi:hypothetical protein R3W88_023304 [Solanum pinnatisectum]|uniref:Transcription repressor n=1 Tax=Solanum pinnatisectum TaxID=50273 RepID=A0AAV9LX40_9SOLN|nr:hypothetical protein R3W88_023304 [Solanum pinnatisectum]